MKPPPFRYHAPRSLDEAVATLAQHGSDGKVLAGGQSLIPLLSMRLACPDHLVDINGIAGLAAITVTDQAVRVGALVRHAALLRDPAARAALPLLAQALTYVAHPAIRNRGTSVGSIAHADPAAELPAVAVLTDAIIEVASCRGTREIHAADFACGPLESSLEPDEIAVAVRFSRFGPTTRTAFSESSRRHGDYALAGVAVALDVDESTQSVTAARAAFLSVGPVPILVDLSPALAGNGVNTPALSEVVEIVHAAVDPEADIHATAAYRRMLAAELACRTVAAALKPKDPR